MSETNSQDDPAPCDWEDCEELSVVEVTWGQEEELSNEEECRADNLCKTHSDARLEQVREDNQLKFDLQAYPDQLKHAHRRVIELQSDLIRNELKKDETNIRVPDGTDPQSVIAPEETERKLVQAGTYDAHEIWILYESEEHAKEMDSEDLFEQRRDLIYMTSCWSGARGGPSVDGGLTSREELRSTPGLPDIVE